ncbi:MAG: discoidin domain-containing protein [Deltaproteobacteria bacterium]|nr:discoidin domain-containing protein [Deltaproteobacteria bacterium]
MLTLPLCVARVLASLLALWLGLMVTASAQADEGVKSLLVGKTPVASSGISDATALTDQRLSTEGDFWLTDVTTRFRDKNAYAIYDLGGPQPIRCVFLQGDNNDFYQIDGSINGDHFFPMFVGPPAMGPGMRTRVAKIVATARFVRVWAHGGDGSYALSEVGLLNACPNPWPQEFHRVDGIPLDQSVKVRLGWVAVAALAFVVLLMGRAKPMVTVAGAAVVLLLAGATAKTLQGLYPFFDQETMIRGLVAAVAAALVAREVLVPQLGNINRAAANVLLGVLAFLAVGCYYHFGAAQFWYAKEGRRTYVHSYDMRHYFPTAKYFHELKFDGLYAASFAAYLEVRNQPFESLGNLHFRDLRESKVRRAMEMRDHIEEVRGRFDNVRWSTFKDDIRLFIDIMGDGAFLENMNDHGGNATPVWLLGAGAILHSMPATEMNLILVGLLDPLALAFMFFCVGRAFGWRTLGYVLVLFGATDFYQFGSNLMGSMLRQDWLVMLGLGACAFKKQRHMLGGALFAYGGLLRAFPALAAIFMLVPTVWWVIDFVRIRKKWPSWSAFKAAERSALAAFAGAAACVVVLLSLSVAVHGPSSWAAWANKISIHENDISVNNIGLRNVMAFDPSATGQKLAAAGVPNPWGQWEQNFRANLERRAPVRFGLMLAFVGCVFVAGRRRSPESAGLISLTLVPVLFYPSNYYLHLIFLLPLALTGIDDLRRQAQWIFTLCLLCVGQFATYGWTRGQSDLFFTYQSIMLLIAFAAMLVPLARDAWRAPATTVSPA